jgi:diadenosine tetraphosphate (Ap4A) HIT family hydrolase
VPGQKAVTLVEGCLTCDTLRGKVQVPGGIVVEEAHWAFFCQSRPLMVPGRGFIVLKRHCEHLDEITAQEAAALGPMMQRTAHVVRTVLRPVKVHFGLYGEGVKHIHWHVVPRMAYLPASNLWLNYWTAWIRILNRLGLKRAYPDEQVAPLAEQMRVEFERLKEKR